MSYFQKQEFQSFSKAGLDLPKTFAGTISSSFLSVIFIASPFAFIFLSMAPFLKKTLLTTKYNTAATKATAPMIWYMARTPMAAMINPLTKLPTPRPAEKKKLHSHAIPNVSCYKILTLLVNPPNT